MNILNILSTLVLLIIAGGIIKRRTARIHYPLMLTAFALDIGMVLYIELAREAVKTATSGPPPLLMFHIVISCLVIICYLVQFYLGWRLISGRSTSSRSHLITGILFCILRLTNYVTSYMIPTTVATVAISSL